MINVFTGRCDEPPQAQCPSCKRWQDEFPNHESLELLRESLRTMPTVVSVEGATRGRSIRQTLSSTRSGIVLLEATPKWEMALVRLFGKRIVDERGYHVCWIWRGKPYFRVSRY